VAAKNEKRKAIAKPEAITEPAAPTIPVAAKKKKAKKAKKKGNPTRRSAKAIKGAASRTPKYPRHTLTQCLRIPKAILDQNAGRIALRKRRLNSPASHMAVDSGSK
jgi:hypothetical protein